MNSDIAQHFRPSELNFVQQCQDWINQSLAEYRLIVTPFLNPRERFILESLVNREQALTLSENGIFETAEMQRVAVCPDYIDTSQLTMQDFDLVLLAVKYPSKFIELHHRTLLGSLMHNGIERDRVGDIVTDDQGIWQVATTSVVAEFIQTHIERLGKAPVQFNVITPSQAILPNIQWETLDVLVSSARLDTVIAGSYSLSRSIAKDLVENGLVRLNWAPQNHPDIEVASGDLISVRGYGRLHILADNGLTRKSKHKLSISKLVK